MRSNNTRDGDWSTADAGFLDGARLRVMGGDKTVSIPRPRLNVGTGRNNDLVISDRYVSKRHCELYWVGNRLRIRDQRSLNGTWVGNVKVEECELNRGVRIMIGKTGLEIVGKTPEGGKWGMIGDCAKTRKVYEQIERFGPLTTPILVLGDTGTGKELVARALHDSSQCRLGPYEVVNCGAIPRSLAESHLFGHEKGAFTGADRTHCGVFERADGGTIFLDEIGELPADLQPKLLRVLEQGVVHRVGGESPTHVRVRVIAATHRNLSTDVEQKRFRMDLYHRLAATVICIPSLKERIEDLPLLVNWFMKQARGSGQPFELAKSVIPFLSRHPWSGNIRELKNAVTSAALLGGPVLEPTSFTNLWVGPNNRGAGTITIENRHFSDIRREVYVQTIAGNGGNRSAAAMALGIPKSTFFDHLKLMGL
jgi:DNA-binding NtrC family response regulator